MAVNLGSGEAREHRDRYEIEGRGHAAGAKIKSKMLAQHHQAQSLSDPDAPFPCLALTRPSAASGQDLADMVYGAAEPARTVITPRPFRGTPRCMA